jgi:type VI protein secretion system component Hcp
VTGGDEQGGHGVLERVSFSFNKISVQYTPQAKDGSGLGTMEYTDQFDDAQ